MEISLLMLAAVICAEMLPSKVMDEKIMKCVVIVMLIISGLSLIAANVL